MKSNFERIGSHIRLVDERDDDLRVKTLLGLTIDKSFIPSVANTIGSDMANYKIIRKGQFACSLMQVRRDKRIPVALLTEIDEAIISPAYPVFEIIDTEKLLPEYLMMWFRRPEFDREACFYAVGGVRGSLEWEDFCNMALPVPSLEKQREIVKEYHTIVGRIKLNEQLSQKLEETAQSIYKQWFVDFEFPIPAEYAAAIGKPELEGHPYKSSGGEMVLNEVLKQEIPEGWHDQNLIEIVNMKYGKMLDARSMTDRGYPVFSGYGIRGYYKEYMYEEPQILVIARGVSGTGEVRMSPAKSYITNLSIILEMNNPEFVKEYLFYHLDNSNLRSLDSGSAQSMITIADLEKFSVLKPPIELQIKFGHFSSAVTSNSLYCSEMQALLITFRKLLYCKMARSGDSI